MQKVSNAESQLVCPGFCRSTSNQFLPLVDISAAFSSSG